MWRVRRRIRRLEGELAETRASQAELRRRLEFFEMIAAATGAAPPRPVPSEPIPPPLLAAARELHRQDVPVRLDVAGAGVIAVIGGEGDPREWWTAIWELACQAGKAVIRVSHVSLPAGLTALARRGPAGELVVYVSDVLPPNRQRAVVRIALRASRRPGLRAALPAPSAAILLASGVTWLRRAALALRAHAVAWGTASAVLAAASTAVYFATVPHRPAGSAAPPAPAVSRSPAGLRTQPGTAPRAQPSARASAAAAQGGPRPLATVAVRRTPVPAPAPAGSPSPAPVPSASPSPPPSPVPTVRVRHCITVLGIRACLRVAL